MIPPRPLLVRFGAFGDMVLVAPLLRLIRARTGQPVDVVTSGPWSRPLLESDSSVGEIVTLRSRRTPYWLSSEQQALVRWLRERPPGPVWCCDSGPVRELLRRAAIPDERICAGGDLERRDSEHVIERWLRFGELTPSAWAGGLREAPRGIDANAHLELPADADARLDAWLDAHGLADRPLIAFQAGNKRTMRGWNRRRASNTKYWPEEHWGEVIRAVRADCPGHAILLLGVAPEASLNEDIRRAAGTAAAAVHNVATDLPIPVLLPLLRRCHSLITVDTGPAHAAAALGCPTVALFGTAPPSQVRPGGVSTPAACLVGHVDGVQSMLGIEPGAVIEAWRALTHAPPVLSRTGVGG